MGYHRAGYEVVGVDLKPGKRYPFEYLRQDVLTLDVSFLQQFDLIHASPPCQTFSITKNLRIAQGKTSNKLDLVEPVRALLQASGKPYIIENVPGAPLLDPVLLCGSAFGLKVRRHRMFESNRPLVGTTCNHKSQGRPVGVYGSLRDEIPGGGRTANSIEEAREAMGIDWLIWTELVEAIPPQYTEYLARQI